MVKFDICRTADRRPRDTFSPSTNRRTSRRDNRAHRHQRRHVAVIGSTSRPSLFRRRAVIVIRTRGFDRKFSERYWQSWPGMGISTTEVDCERRLRIRAWLPLTRRFISSAHRAVDDAMPCSRYWRSSSEALGSCWHRRGKRQYGLGGAVAVRS